MAVRLQSDFIKKALNFFAIFYRSDSSLEDERRVTLHVILSLVGIVFLIVFGVIAFFQQNLFLSIADLSTAFILSVNLYFLYKFKKYRYNIIIGISFVSVLYVYLYISGGTDNTAFCWYYTYPLIACYLLGSFYGITASALMTIPVLVLVFWDPQSSLIAEYDLNFELRFLAAYATVSVFSYFFERQGESNRRELSRINASLETRILERTAELMTKNEQLKREVGERKRAEISARLSQENLTTIMDSIDGAIYLSDCKSCEILFINRYMSNLFGKDLIGRICWKDLCRQKEPCESCKMNVTIDNDTNPGEPLIWEGVNPATKKWSININRTIKWIDGRYAHLHIATDISHIKKLQNERRSMELKLQRAQKMEALGALAGGVAHDLNNVLSGIVSYPEIILWKLDDDSPLRKPIRMIQESGQKAAEIVEDLLTLARRGVKAKEVVNINEVIIGYLKSPEYLKLLSHHKNISVKTNLEQKLLNIMASPIHIRKTVMNLVSNAAEAQPNGGEIRISTVNRNIDFPQTAYEQIHEGDFAVLIVSDKGCGMSKEELDRIFEPFYTKKVMGRSGTGLGMAVVWGTVQDHHGYIDIKSEKDEGTTFYLYFPVERDLQRKEKELVSIDEFMGDNQVILIVDDIFEQRKIAAEILELLNYKPVAVASGEEAVQFLKSHSVDLIILDMVMEPDMDGLETFTKILEISPKQKAIIASGFAETDRVKEVLQLGACQYIKKPYAIETIGLAIKNAL